MIVYVIGALKNKKIPEIARTIRAAGHDVYDEWWCPGEFADINWQQYSKDNGLTYSEALNSWHAKQVFEIDLFHLDRCDAAVLVLPAGKSGHIELGYIKGSRKPAYILLDSEPEKYDIMYKFADLVTTELGDILKELDAHSIKQAPLETRSYIPICGICGEAQQVGESLQDWGRRHEGSSHTLIQEFPPEQQSFDWAV